MTDKQKDTMNSMQILKFLAPGTPLRDGLDNILRAKTGGLIVVGYKDKVKEVVDGGFKIDVPFSPAVLYELAKMDGAIILNEAGTRVLFANAQLIPSSYISSTETGMRHRTAERVAKQTGGLVIAISQRRNVITVYKGNYRYALDDIGVVLTKGNQALQTLEKYKVVLEQSIVNLSALEFEDLVTWTEVVRVFHRIEMILRIKLEIHNYVNELGTEGRLIRLQLMEILSRIEEEALLLIKDYCAEACENPEGMLDKLLDHAHNDLLDDVTLYKLLGYSGSLKEEDTVSPRGYRLLHKVPRLPSAIIENIIKKFHNMKLIIEASVEQLVEVDGIGEIRARNIKEGLKRVKSQLVIDRLI